MKRNGDVAGVSFTTYNLAVIEVLAGDMPTARELLERPIVNTDMPGRHRAIGWQHLMLAQVRRQLGDRNAADESIGRATEIFTALEERAGLAASAELR